MYFLFFLELTIELLVGFGINGPRIKQLLTITHIELWANVSTLLCIAFYTVFLLLTVFFLFSPDSATRLKSETAEKQFGSLY